MTEERAGWGYVPRSIPIPIPTTFGKSLSSNEDD